MKIDNSALIRFINKDLSKLERKKIQLLINNNVKIKSKYKSLKNFQSILKDQAKINKKNKMPEKLLNKISIDNENTKNTKIKFNNLYKIAASLLAFVAIGWLISMPNKTFLSKNPNPYIKNSNSNKIHIFYNPVTLSDFLYENKNNCSIPEKILDENNKEVYAVSCKIN
ncbi:MAG: hypothetical protein CFH28_00868 [Alphaproteobacteria bacterium MarineAlpha6_Bin6]|nr:hypothetical protein [Pelagibacteraceae bacterium]PPR29991.1 MAG: hypothetical protein CFH28_00868 [Alphaproteobacteria bacterium MarineAlpha6_Bin6]PPR33220.1 MAG: hypothetical protein CFH27_00638 [Alphaproteobacteria bacterium MarineAlpha6_Bin5]|tara:strand:- start:17 stop:523 length:507 start_codon:yes stop_codon:yes gene_type:complete